MNNFQKMIFTILTVGSFGSNFFADKISQFIIGGVCCGLLLFFGFYLDYIKAKKSTLSKLEFWIMEAQKSGIFEIESYLNTDYFTAKELNFLLKNKFLKIDNERYAINTKPNTL